MLFILFEKSSDLHGGSPFSPLPCFSTRGQEEHPSLHGESESLGELLSLVNDALSITIDEDFGDIESAVGALIDGYHDAVEEADDLA